VGQHKGGGMNHLGGGKYKNSRGNRKRRTEDRKRVCRRTLLPKKSRKREKGQGEGRTLKTYLKIDCRDGPKKKKWLLSAKTPPKSKKSRGMLLPKERGETEEKKQSSWNEGGVGSRL